MEPDKGRGMTDNLPTPPRTCAQCDALLTQDEKDDSDRLGRHLGRYYCSRHLPYALNGDYSVVFE
nr:hypothetical protein 30 [bacterium]